MKFLKKHSEMHKVFLTIILCALSLVLMGMFASTGNYLGMFIAIFIAGSWVAQTEIFYEEYKGEINV